jgi:hypothetical protein
MSTSGERAAGTGDGVDIGAAELFANVWENPQAVDDVPPGTSARVRRVVEAARRTSGDERLAAMAGAGMTPAERDRMVAILMAGTRRREPVEARPRYRS